MLNCRPRTEAQKSIPHTNGKKSTAAAPLAFDTSASKRPAKMVLLKGESPTIFLTLARRLHRELATQSHIESMLTA